MIQRQIYLLDSYMFRIETVGMVTSVDATLREVVLQDNIFHPPGGGQPADIGLLNGNVVSEVLLRIEGGKSSTVILCYDNNGLLVPGRLMITASVDRTSRLEVMALHSAGHLVNAAGRSLGLSYRSCNHRPGQASIEFNSAEKIGDDAIADQVSDFVNTAIAQDIKVLSVIDPNGRREVIIGDVCRDSCGGTHVVNTSEISSFGIRSIRNKQGTLRIGYTATFRESAT